MGLNISVYRSSLGDCTNGGVSANADHLCVVNADGPFEPSDDCPAVILESHHRGILRLVPAEKVDGVWHAKQGWFMNGGNLGSTSDSRFGEKCEKLLGHTFYGAVHIHDRLEN